MKVLVTLGVSFLLGILAGAYAEDQIHRHAFLIPAGVTGSAGILYAGYRVLILRRTFLDVTEMEVVDVPADILEDAGVLPASQTRGRASSNSSSNDAFQIQCARAHGGMSTTVASLDRHTALQVLEEGQIRRIGSESSVSSAPPRLSEQSRQQRKSTGSSHSSEAPPPFAGRRSSVSSAPGSLECGRSEFAQERV